LWAGFGEDPKNVTVMADINLSDVIWESHECPLYLKCTQDHNRIKARFWNLATWNNWSLSDSIQHWSDLQCQLKHLSTLPTLLFINSR
jgi:hypothetical protein